MKIQVSGASDDLIEIDGDISDEFNWLSSTPWAGDLVAPNGETMRLHVLLGMEGCWHVAVGQVDEEQPLPDWPITIRQGSAAGGTADYTVVLEVEAPDRTRLAAVDDD